MRRWSDRPGWGPFIAVLVLVAGVLGWSAWRTAREDGAGQRLSQSPPPARGPVRTDADAQQRAARHVLWDEARCLAQTGRTVAAHQTVHRWTDANGVAHFSDRPPATGTPRDHRVQALALDDPVALDIVARDARLPPHVTSLAVADAVAIAKVLRGVLGIRTDGGLRLTVLLAGSDAAFEQAIGQPRGRRAGVYMGARRQIVVRTQPDEARTLAVLRHEIAHALVHEWIGRLPDALNEGLAEYFEELAVQGMGGTVDTRGYAARLRTAALGGAPGMALRRLLALGYDDFHGHAEARHYTWSLGLVSALMADSDGVRALSAVLAAQRAQPCQPVDAAAVLSRRGARALEHIAERWALHLRGGSHGVRSY